MLSDRNGRRIACSVPRILTTFGALAAFVAVRSREELVHPFIVLRRPRTCLKH